MKNDEELSAEELRTKYYDFFKACEKDGSLFYYENRMFNMRSPVFIGDENLIGKCADYLTGNPIGTIQCNTNKKYAACVTQLHIGDALQSYIFLNEKKIKDYRNLIPHECTHAAVRTYQLLGVDHGINEGNKSGEILAILIGDMSEFIINKVEEYINHAKLQRTHAENPEGDGSVRSKKGTHKSNACTKSKRADHRGQ